MALSSLNKRNDYTGTGSQVVFPYTFKIVSDEHILVIHRDSDGIETTLTLDSDYTVSNVGNSAGGNVTLIGSYASTPPSVSERISIIRQVPITQGTDYTENERFPAEIYEDDLDYRTMVELQLQEQLDRAPKFAFSSTTANIEFPDPTGSTFIQWNDAGTALVNSSLVALSDSLTGQADDYIRVNSGETAYEFRTPTEVRTDIAAQPLDAALTSLADSATIDSVTIGGTTAGAGTFTALTATTSIDLTDGGTNITALSTDGTLAGDSNNTLATEKAVKQYVDTATSASAVWNDVVYVTNADSPVTVATTDNGKIYSCDASGGAITINLPTIAGSGTLVIAVKKTDSSANAITMNPSGSETVDGGASFSITTTNAGARFASDEDLTPDDWLSMSFGPTGGNLSDEVFTDGVGFTAGSSTTVSLSGSYGVETNLWVSFDGIIQHSDTYTLSGNTLTFGSAIPSGVSTIHVKGGGTLAINTPGDDTVTAAKIADNAVGNEHLQDDAVDSAEIADDAVGIDAVDTDVISTKVREINADTSTSINLAASDSGDVVTMNNAGSNSVYLPTNASAALDVGFQCDIIQLGAGVTSIIAPSGVTLNGVSDGTTTISDRYKAATVLKIATDTWVVIGAVEDVT